jgi:hypothetical protein
MLAPPLLLKPLTDGGHCVNHSGWKSFKSENRADEASFLFN